MRTNMPIMRNPLMDYIPMDMIAPHERQAQRNHGQKLDRLAERGGLSACEAIAILEDRRWHRMGTPEENAFTLVNKVREWRAAISGQKPAEGETA